MSRTAARRAQPRVTKPQSAPFLWPVWLFAAAAALLAIWAYSPALEGEFVFDDLHLPVMQRAASSLPLVSFLGIRPLLMFTYWLNLHSSGMQPFGYHVVNLAFHLAAAALLFFVVRKILELNALADPLRATLSVLCSAIFLLHPMQTEAVSYVAQRGEAMGAMFFLGAWCVFLYRGKSAVSWPVAAAILALYGAAVATKEHTVTLPAALLLTDYFFHPETPGFTGIRSNWRLYAPLAIGGAVGAVLVGRYISRDTGSIGFNIKEFTWYQYLFTQWRVFFVYLGLFILPIWQTIDYDFAISQSPLSHGALFAFLGLLVLLAAAVYFRKRYPLACFGFLLFGLILLPTSSVIPIKDVIADRRLYLPMTGLLFICAEGLRRFRFNWWFAGLLTLALAGGTFARNQVWASSLALWQDAAEKAPNKQRVQFGLAVAEFRAGHCRQAIEHYRRSAELVKPDYMILMNWSLALDCDHQPEQAIAKMQESLRDQPSAQSYSSLGLLYARQGKATEALAALYKAQETDATFTPLYLYRAKILAAMDQPAKAMQELKELLALDPTDQNARQMLDQLQGQPH